MKIRMTEVEKTSGIYLQSRKLSKISRLEEKQRQAKKKETVFLRRFMAQIAPIKPLVKHRDL